MLAKVFQVFENSACVVFYVLKDASRQDEIDELWALPQKEKNKLFYRCFVPHIDSEYFDQLIPGMTVEYNPDAAFDFVRVKSKAKKKGCARIPIPA